MGRVPGLIVPSVARLPSVRFVLGLRWGVGFGGCFGVFGVFESAQWQDAGSREMPLQDQYGSQRAILLVHICLVAGS